MEKNYYQILGLPITCADAEIRTAYRKLAVKFHPDKNQNDKYFEERFKELQEAYEVLSNPTTRREYDIKIGKKTTQQPSPPKKPTSDPKKEQRTTPQSLATDVEAIYQKLKWTESEQINYNELLKLLDSVLNENLVTQLIRIGDISSNERIVNSVGGLTKFLKRTDLQRYVPLLVRLSGANNDLISKIHEIEKEKIRKEKLGMIFTGLKWAVGIAFTIWIFYPSNKTDSSNSSSNYKYSPDPVIDTEPETIQRTSKFLGNQLKTGDSPYNQYFGSGVYNKAYKNQLEVKNGQSQDVIVCLTEYYGNKRTIRNEYIRAGESFVMTSIPNGTYFLKSFYGKNWNPDTLLYNGQLRGFFDTESGFSVSDRFDDLINMQQTERTYSIFTVTLYPVVGGNMESRNITASDFFK
jgi:curved DNA-binding protein CbpA